MQTNSKIKRKWKQVIAMITASALVSTSGIFGEGVFVKAEKATIKMVEDIEDRDLSTQEIVLNKPECVDGVYQISTKEELYWFADYVNSGTLSNWSNPEPLYANAILLNDIIVNKNVLNDDGSLNDGNYIMWTPIGGGGGSSGYSNRYLGIFNGNGFTISGLYIESDNMTSIGLFDCSEGEIKNLTISDSFFSYIEPKSSYPYTSIGTVCGTNYGKIKNCHSVSHVMCTRENLTSGICCGGICGINGGTVENTFFEGMAEAKRNKALIPGNYLGGICGENSGIINKCGNNGEIVYQLDNISETSHVRYALEIGGIAGSNNTTDAIIKNSYNKGKVICNSNISIISSNSPVIYLGGICGENTYGSIESCYNIGEINGVSNAYFYTKVYAGGICGYNYYNTNSLDNCYNWGYIDVFVSTFGESANCNCQVVVGGVCGQTNGYVRSSYNIGVINANVSVNYDTSKYDDVLLYKGGVCGNGVIDKIVNCYYLNNTAEYGMYGNTNIESKTEREFASGDVWLLLNENSIEHKIWKQNIGSDSYPLLNIDSLEDNNFPTPTSNTGNTNNPPTIVPNDDGSTKVTIDNYTVYVTDTSGKPIYNACVTIGTNTDYTDNKGKVSFDTITGKEKDGVTTISLQVSQMGYTDYVCYNYAVKENHVAYVTLKTVGETREEETSYSLLKGEYVDSVLYKDALLGSIDLLVNKKTISLSEPNNTFDLTVNILEDKKDLVKGYRLYSGKKRVADSENGVFSNLKYSQFAANTKVYLELDIDPGTGEIKRASTSRQIINLSVKAPNEVAKNSYGNLELGKSLAFTVSEDVPFIGGTKFDLKELKLPTNMKFSTDGSYILTINTDEDKIVNKDNVLFKDYDLNKIINKDELDENLYNVFASSVKKSTENLANGKDEKAFKGFDMKFSDNFTFKTQIGGYITGKLTDSLKQGTGNLYILAKASYKAEQTVIMYTIPFTVSMEIGASGKASATLHFDFFDTSKTFGESIKGDVLFSFTPYVKVGVGPGSSHLNIKLNGGFSLPINYYMLGENPGLQSIALQANASISGKVFCMEKEWEFYNGKYNIYTRPENLKKQSIPIVDWFEKQWGTTKNHKNLYTNVSKTKVQSVTAKSIRDWNTTKNASEETELLEKVSAYTDTQTVTAGDTTVMVYRDTNADRDGYNADTLYYSIYDKGTKTWTIPKQVDQNDTADYDFTLYADDTDIYLVYQEMASIHTQNDTIEDMAADTRMVYTKFNQVAKQFETTEILADNANYVMNPTIVTNENTVTVAWVENTSKDYYALNHTNSIMAKSCVNGVWQDTVTLVKNLSNVCQLKGCVLNNTTYIAYITDEDNTLDTETDRDVFLVDLQGKIKTLCSDDVMNANLIYVQGNTKNALYWYHGDRIVYVTSEEGTYSELVKDLQINPNEDFSVIGTKEQQAVLFTKTGENEETELYLMYQQQDGSYCEPVQVTSDGKYISGYSGTILDGKAVLNYRKDNIQKSGNSVNVSSVLCSKEISDFSKIECSSVSFDYDTLKKGQSLTVTTDIMNAGNHKVSDLQVALMAPSGETVYTATKNIMLNIGETVSKEIEIDIPENLEKGNYTLSIWESGYTKERGATNTLKFVYAELEMYAEVVTLGENTYIAATVKNRGDLATKATVSVVNNSNEEKALKTVELDEIKASDYDTSFIQVTEDMLDAGELYSDFTVSVSATEEECYQYDNSTLLQVESRVKSMQINKESLELDAGKQETLSVVVEAFGTPKFNYEWSSSNPNIATVDKNGIVTALAKGETVITVITEQGDFASCKVSVIGNKVVTEIPATPQDSPTPTLKVSTAPQQTTTPIPTLKVSTAPQKTATPTPEASTTPQKTATPTPEVSITPQKTTTPATEKPFVPQVTKTPVTESPAPSPITTVINKGTKITVGNNIYAVTNTAKKTVSFSGLVKKTKKKVTIPATITYNGQKYKVTSIGEKAFSGNKKVTTVTIGKNVTDIGAKAFYKCTKLAKITIPSKVNKIGKQAFQGCSKLKNITIKTTKLTTKNVGSKAFKGIAKKVVIKVPKSKKKVYQKLLRKKGISNKAKITKI
ncbi:MAG: leucine-rich repeat protein [Lachnospiraceae bacterium]|nr:leucine-rich repeat protein [Lachnospiraceae bacterium]